MIVLAMTLALAGPGAWIVSEERSRLDGAVSYLGGIESDEPLRNSIGQPEKAMLSMTCVGGRRRVTLAWPTYLGRGGVHLFWNFGGTGVRDDVADVLASGTTAVLQGRVADRFMDQVAAGHEVVIAAAAAQERQEAVFALEGGAEVVAAVRRACPGR